MFHKLFVAVALSFGILPLISQSSVSGKVIDDSGVPVPFANVLILSAQDSMLVKGDLTDDSGYFKMELDQAGTFLIQASYLGFNDVYSESFDLEMDEEVMIDDLILTEGVALDAVSVVAKKPLFEQKIDRMVVNVASSLTSSGGSALDVLEKSPGVIVNRQSNALSLIGKEGVVIMINGKVSYQPAEGILQSLEGMSAENIETIELITTPPANFDAEGNAGFINIVLKQRNDLGFNGNVSASIGYGEGPTGSGNLSMNYRKNKLNIFSNYSIFQRAQKQFFYNYRSVNFNQSLTESEVSTDRDPDRVNQNLRLGLDYELGQKTVVGVLFGAYNNKWTMDALNDGNTQLDQVLQSRLAVKTNELNQWKHLSGNLNLEHKLNEKQKFTINLDRLWYDANNPNDYEVTISDGNNVLVDSLITRSKKNTPININVAQLDYENKISEKISMVSGAKVAFSEFENDVSVETRINEAWVFDDQFTNESDLEEKIYALYTAFDYSMDSKNLFKVGLRFEYTDSDLITRKEGQVVDRQFGKLFPSIFYSRTINEEQGINLSYTKRITRPTFNEMAPFAIFLDPNTYFFGNAGLQPAITDNYKAEYRYKSYLMSIQYSVEDSTIARFQDRVFVESNQQAFEPINMSSVRSLTGSISVPVYIGNYWTMQNNLLVQWVENNSYYDETFVQFEQTSYSINSTQNFTLNSSLSFELNGFYRAPRFSGRSTLKAIYGISTGIQKKFNDGSSLRFNVRDIFNSIEFRGGTDLPEQGFTTDGIFDFSNRTFSVSYSTNFGNQKLKQARRRATGSEEERNRVQ